MDFTWPTTLRKFYSPFGHHKHDLHLYFFFTKISFFYLSHFFFFNNSFAQAANHNCIAGMFCLLILEQLTFVYVWKKTQQLKPKHDIFCLNLREIMKKLNWKKSFIKKEIMKSINRIILLSSSRRCCSTLPTSDLKKVSFICTLLFSSLWSALHHFTL